MLKNVVEYQMLTAQKPVLEGFPSGQWERTVNPSAPPSKVRILLPPSVAGWSSWQLVGLITRRSQVRVLLPQYADIAQQVERILGKDEVSSSNLDISFSYSATQLSWLEHTVHTRSVSSSNLLIATFGRHIRYEYVFFLFHRKFR